VPRAPSRPFRAGRDGHPAAGLARPGWGDPERSAVHRGDTVSITRVLGTLREWNYPVSLRPPFPRGGRRPHQLPRDTRRGGRLLGRSRFRRPCRMGTRDARARGRPFQVARRRYVPCVRSRLRRNRLANWGSNIELLNGVSANDLARTRALRSLAVRQVAETASRERETIGRSIPFR
jgi:hypothetical protein